MRNAIKKNKKSLALAAVAAAGLSTWVGAPAAHGAFVITPINMGNTTIGAATYTTFVFTAAGDATSGTLLESGDVTTDAAAGSLGVDIEHATGTGVSAKYTANLDGSLPPTETNLPAGTPGATASGNAGASAFGDPGAGTFGGFGFDVNTGAGTAESYDPGGDLTDAPFTTQGAGSTAFVYTNNQTSTFGLGSNGGVAAFWNAAKLTGTNHLDSAFENGTSLQTVGGIVNGPNLFSLETLFAAFNGSSTTFQPASAADPDPFYQVVVKAGTTFTLHGSLVANNATELFSTVIGPVTINNTPSITLTLTNNTPGSTLGATLHVTGGNGHYLLVNSAVASGAQASGYADVTGFNPATDVEVYGLQVDVNGSPATGSVLATLVADINASLNDANQNATALPPGPASGPGQSAAALLQGLGDNVEVVASDVHDDIFPSWVGLNGATVTQISVVPEPTGIAAMVLGGSALLARKRRRKA